MRYWLNTVHVRGSGARVQVHGFRCRHYDTNCKAAMATHVWGMVVSNEGSRADGCRALLVMRDQGQTATGSCVGGEDSRA